MKNLKRIITIVVFIVAISISASAQLRFGIKAGTAINRLDLNSKSDLVNSFVDSENRAGFTGGLMLEFQVPVVGLCLDASVMYVHRSSTFTIEDENISEKESRDYIDIPINLKYKFGIPVISNIVKPYLLTGPAFAFLVNKNAIAEAYKTKNFDFSWNFGLGVELVNHLQIQASYGLGLTKVFKTGESVKNNYWTVTAAYLF